MPNSRPGLETRGALFRPEATGGALPARLEHSGFGTGKAAALALLVLLLGAACSRPADEARLRETVDDMQQALKERSLAGVMDHVAEDFAGSHGLDRSGLRRMLQAQILGNARIGATLGPLEVELQGDRATLRAAVLFTGGSGRFIPQRGRAYSVVSGWRVEGGDWRLFYAEWEDGPP